MSKSNSPTYAQGRTDGLADAKRVRKGAEPVGPQPPFPQYPHMYNRGYYETFNPDAAEGEAG